MQIEDRRDRMIEEENRSFLNKIGQKTTVVDFMQLQILFDFKVGEY